MTFMKKYKVYTKIIKFEDIAACKVRFADEVKYDSCHRKLFVLENVVWPTSNIEGRIVFNFHTKNSNNYN